MYHQYNVRDFIAFCEHFERRSEAYPYHDGCKCAHAQFAEACGVKYSVPLIREVMTAPSVDQIIEAASVMANPRTFGNAAANARQMLNDLANGLGVSLYRREEA